VRVSRIFNFPNPVNEKAARFVAGVVALTGITILATGWYWLLIPVTYGFWARVLTGPTLSPLARLAMKVMGREPKHVPGPPKRFAQGMGAAMTSIATILWLTGSTTAAGVLVAMLVVAATLESVFAICLGCHVFSLVMRAGLIPDAVCAECADITLARGRRAPAAHQPSPRAP
jgi:Domain of unknown function (DUF4395)